MRAGIGEKNRGEVAVSADKGGLIAEWEVIPHLCIEEAAIKAVDLKLLALLVCQCDGGMVSACKAVPCCD